MHMPPTFPVRGSALQLSVAETLISIEAAVARQTALVYNTKKKNKQTNSIPEKVRADKLQLGK